MTQHLDRGLHVEQPLFRRRKLVAARQEVAGDGLRVSADKGTARMKKLAEEVVRLRGLGGAMRTRRLALGKLIVAGNRIRLLYRS